MEPKDLQNLEGVKSTQELNNENPENNATPYGEEGKAEGTPGGAGLVQETPGTSAVKVNEGEGLTKDGATVETKAEETKAAVGDGAGGKAEKTEEEKPVAEIDEVPETKKTQDRQGEGAAAAPAEATTHTGGENPGPVAPATGTGDEGTVEASPQRESKDYSKYSQVELVNELRDILDSNEPPKIKKEGVELIKSVFYKNLKADMEAQKKKFLDEGGNIEEFEAEGDPYEQDIKDLLKRYRHIRIEFNKNLEIEKEDNLKLKYEVIEDIKALINKEESINKTFQEFRDLQRCWREIGLVPQAEMKNLWDTYHFHVENFYDYIKINKELRDLDLKKNLEAKIKLCERAEELLVEPSAVKAFNTLQKFHEIWRETGPVPIEQKDDIWERFKIATSKINKKYHEFFETRKSEQKKNLEAKIALCEKVEEINQAEINSYKEWDEKSKELIELQKVWRTIGFASRKENNKIYERFRTGCDTFFDARRDFYSKNKELQQNNLQMKLELCNEAESMKESTDWGKTTQDFINIQKRWKEIGPVPRKHSEPVWKRFRAACDYFFDKKTEHFSGINSEQFDNLELKNGLVKEVEDFNPGDNVDENLKKLKAFQRRWTEIGHVPIKNKDDVQNRFRTAIDKLFDALNLDEEKRNLLKFKSKMSSFSESGRGQNKMRMEREKYMNKLKQLENDLVLLDNNIGFFAKSKNAESLIEDVKKKIEDTKQKIEFIKEKVRVIDDLDTDDI